LLPDVCMGNRKFSLNQQRVVLHCRLLVLVSTFLDLRLWVKLFCVMYVYIFVVYNFFFGKNQFSMASVFL
jgi:hypothetical protein